MSRAEDEVRLADVRDRHIRNHGPETDGEFLLRLLDEQAAWAAADHEELARFRFALEQIEDGCVMVEQPDGDRHCVVCNFDAEECPVECPRAIAEDALYPALVAPGEVKP